MLTDLIPIKYSEQGAQAAVRHPSIGALISARADLGSGL